MKFAMRSRPSPDEILSRRRTAAVAAYGATQPASGKLALPDCDAGKERINGVQYALTTIA